MADNEVWDGNIGNIDPFYGNQNQAIANRWKNKQEFASASKEDIFAFVDTLKNPHGGSVGYDYVGTLQGAQSAIREQLTELNVKADIAKTARTPGTSLEYGGVLGQSKTSGAQQKSGSVLSGLQKDNSILRGF